MGMARGTRQRKVGRRGIRRRLAVGVGEPPLIKSWAWESCPRPGCTLVPTLMAHLQNPRLFYFSDNEEMPCYHGGSWQFKTIYGLCSQQLETLNGVCSWQLHGALAVLKGFGEISKYFTAAQTPGPRRVVWLRGPGRE